MALEDIRQLLEDRLRDLVPTESLDPGSRAQVEFIEPILAKLGTDPLSTDVDAFIQDRFAQEFPDIFSGSPSFVSDIFCKPLQVILEPLRRETQLIKQNQSLKNPSVLSDEDADALVANVFDERPPGGLATGAARLYYANPTNSSAEITNRFFTSGGLSFFPTSPVSITAEEMVFNREGALFFFDLQVQAKEIGSEYNIDINTLTGVEGIFGVVKVGNPRKFQDGASSLDTPSFVAAASQALSERSLVTRRGASARINKDFAGQVRAIQVIGAEDDEMQRDLLVAASPGHAWLTGTVNLYKQVAYVRCRTVDGDPSIDVLNVGDTLYVYLPQAAYPGLVDTTRLVRLTVTKVMAGPVNDVAPYRVAYFCQFAGTLPVAVSGAVTLEGGFAKKGTVQISSIPDVGAVSLTAPNGQIHVYGHTDIYVRPILQPVSTALPTGIYDYQNFIQRENLTTIAASNQISDSGNVDFAAMGVAPGDMLTIDQGSDAGTYIIGAVVTTSLYLTVNLTTSATKIRYRVMKKVRIDPFEPKIPKFPFGTNLSNDLSTTIGSNKFVLQLNNVANYGAQVGDIVRIKGGLDAGDFTITGFDTILGGRGLLVDRLAKSSAANLNYEIFTALDKVSRPLVRVKQIDLLDSSKQTTGITVPPADAIAVVPTTKFTTAKVRASSARKSGYVLPDLAPLYISGLIPNANFAATSGDRRYSLSIDVAQGNYRSMLSADGYKAELDFRTDSKGTCSYFLSVAETTTDPVNLPPIDPKPGDCLYIKSGPNQGSYLIRTVYKFKFHNAAAQEVQCYFLQIYGSFPVDVFGQIISFLQAQGVSITAIPGTGDISFPTFFQSFRDTLGSKIDTAIVNTGASSPGATALQAMVADQVQCDYDWGDPSRGVLRTYFQEPTTFEQWTALNATPTLFSYLSSTGEVVKYRPNPNLYTKQALYPARLTSDVNPMAYPRDLDASVGGTATFTDTTKPTPFALGVQAGDVVSVNVEIFFFGTSKTRQMAIQTVAGSSIITAPSATGTPFDVTMEGTLLSIEEGADLAMYRVVKFIDSNNLQLDRALTATTLSILAQGSGATWQFTGGSDVVTTASPASPSLSGKYLTLFGIDTNYVGSFPITSIVGTAITVNRGSAGHFPASLGTAAYWVITDAPGTAPTVIGTATTLVGVRGIRMYTNASYDFVVSAVPFNNASSYTLTYNGTIPDGFHQPYRIYRPNVRRVTTSEMNQNTDGAYFYFDTEVVSLSPHDGANLQDDAYLTLIDGTYRSDGYRHVVIDSNLSYSMEETGWLDLPLRILPIGSSDRQDNFISVVGSPVLITYEKADLVSQLQTFVDSPLDRVTTSNTLVRHFLPQFISYDATYFGGSAPSTIAQSIIDHINSLQIETPLDVSEDLEKLIINAGGNPETPTKVMLVTHDWKRKRWLETSQNRIGGTTTTVPYAGTPRVSYFVPGPDVSGKESPGFGERINLIRG
jgi:hypothetical protein